MKWWHHLLIAVGVAAVIVIGGVGAVVLSGSKHAVPPVPRTTAGGPASTRPSSAPSSPASAPVSEPAPAPSPLSIAAPAPGSLSGGAWVIRGTGASDLLRGLRVTLLPTAVDRESARPCFALTSREIEDEAHELEKSAARFENLGSLQRDYDVETAKTLRAGAAKERSKLGELDAAALKLGEKNDVTELFAITRSLSPTHRSGVDALALSRSARTATTGSEGKYRFDRVAPGVYLLHARFEAHPRFVEWLVPIVVNDGQDVQQDLFNGNAAAVQN